MPKDHPRKKPVVLCILDGWGDREEIQYNAPKLARTPTFDSLLSTYPSAHLQACGKAVGLPEGQMGNSEVGHIHIGAGRTIWQSLPRIDRACDTKSFMSDTTFLRLVESVKELNGTVHLIGLVSDGGVHAHCRHMVAMENALQKFSVKVKIHAITDGRDSAQKSAHTYLQYIQDNTMGEISTVMGRYWAMDRDNNWDRTQKAYDTIAFGKAEQHAPTPSNVIDKAYANATTDEFIPPTVLGNYPGLQEGDAIFCLNFRADRVRQLLRAIVEDGFSPFNTSPTRLSGALGMVSYSDVLDTFMDTLFPAPIVKNTLGEIIQNAHMTQIRAAETEKYPHVTFFLNGGREVPFTGEERLLSASPKVATYDLKPEMSAFQVTQSLLTRIQKGDVDVAIVNYANPDMVGHTGVLQATIDACEAVDTCLAKLWQSVQSQNGVLLVTADHGNCDIMFDTKKHIPHTTHTVSLVNLIICGAGQFALNDGTLADIAPTVLDLLGLEKPKEMTGRSLRQKI